MATLVTKVIPHTGLLLATSDFASTSSGGDSAATGSGALLVVKNGDSAQHVVTLTIPETVDGQPVASRVVDVPAGDFAFIPLLDLYRNPSDGLAHWTYDAVTGMTAAVIRTSL